MMTNELTLHELSAESLVELPERQLMTGLNLGVNLAVCVDLDVTIGIGGGDCGDSGGNNGGGNNGGGNNGGGGKGGC